MSSWRYARHSLPGSSTSTPRRYLFRPTTASASGASRLRDQGRALVRHDRQARAAPHAGLRYYRSSKALSRRIAAYNAGSIAKRDTSKFFRPGCSPDRFPPALRTCLRLFRKADHFAGASARIPNPVRRVRHSAVILVLSLQADTPRPCAAPGNRALNKDRTAGDEPRIDFHRHRRARTGAGARPIVCTSDAGSCRTPRVA